MRKVLTPRPLFDHLLNCACNHGLRFVKMTPHVDFQQKISDNSFIDKMHGWCPSKGHFTKVYSIKGCELENCL